MRCASNMLTTTGTSLFVMARLTKQRMSAMVCTYREGVWTECWRISDCLNGRQRKRKYNPIHAATHAVSHRGRLRERLQTAMHENGAQIENRSRAHAGTHAVSHRGRSRARTQTTTLGTGARTNLKRTHDTSHAIDTPWAATSEDTDDDASNWFVVNRRSSARHAMGQCAKCGETNHVTARCRHRIV